MIKTRPHPAQKLTIEFNDEVGMVVRGYRLGGGGFLRLWVGGKIPRRTRPYKLGLL